MKQNLFLVFFLIFAIKSFSQDSKYSIESNYPILTKNTLLKEKYYGVIDLGFRGRFLRADRLNMGFHLNGSFFRHIENIKASSFKNLYIIQPKIYAEFNNSQKFRPLLGIGYSLMTYRKSGSVDDGVNLSVGFSYNITKVLFLQIQYDSIFWTEEFTDNRRNYLPVVHDSDNQILKLGIGYRL